MRLHKMKILRISRAGLKYEINREEYLVKTRSTVTDVMPIAEQRQPRTTQRVPSKPRKIRKKSIVVYGRIVRRPKRAVCPSQIRTIDIIGEPIICPKAVVVPRDKTGENNLKRKL